ncbi:MAG: hypothetical protein JHD00_12730 [Akkermansiaceae bacterium]|nr:hypothetical protein [Akkermansiaceae bacterium]
MKAQCPNSFFKIIFCFLALIATLHATPIRFLPWDESIAARKISFSNGTDSVELRDLHPHKRSEPVNWTPTEVPPVLVALDRTTADGKPVTVSLKLSAEMNSPLVLILPDAKHPSGLRCFVIEDSTSSFGWGTQRFINATGKELMVRSDKITKTLPGTWKAIDIDPGGVARNVGIQLAARDNLTAILYSAVWEHDANVRKLIIVVPGTDTQSGTVDLKIIPEDRRSMPARPTKQDT